MNKKGILKHKEVFDAWLAGAEIEYKPKGGVNWRSFLHPDVAVPSFSVASEFRVKTVPIEKWGRVFNDDSIIMYKTEALAKSAQEAHVESTKIVHFVEQVD